MRRLPSVHCIMQRTGVGSDRPAWRDAHVGAIRSAGASRPERGRIDGVEADRVHPVRVQLRHRGAPRPRTGTGSSASAATRRTRRRPATRARRRCASTTTRTAVPGSPRRCADGRTAPSRRSTGTPRSPRWRPASAPCATPTAATSIFYYGGGGQGNHLGGAYSGATLRALGAVYRSNALAQEKTGEFWVNARTMGTMVRADFEHCDVALFVGKNPWQSHGIPRARTTLKEIARDPDRTMIVIDPRRTETADLADIHLQVRPGTDAWLLAAIGAVLVQEALVDRAWLAEHTTGSEEVSAALGAVPVARFCAVSGVDEELVRRAARTIAAAGSVAVFEDLGVQMGLHSTLVSYLEKLRVDADRELREGRRAVRALQPGGAGPGVGARSGGAAQPGGRGPDHLGPRALQRDRGGDPHRSPRPVPGHARRERQPRALARRQPAHAGRARVARRRSS